MVTNILTNTIFFRPIRFIKIAAGTASNKNHRNTIEGRNPAIVSLNPKSAFT